MIEKLKLSILAKTMILYSPDFVLLVCFLFSDEFGIYDAEYCGWLPEGDTGDAFCDLKEWPSPFHLLDYLGQWLLTVVYMITSSKKTHHMTLASTVSSRDPVFRQFRRY